MIPSKKTELNHEGIRVMTPTEWGRLQGFIGYAFRKDGVDTFSFPEGMTDGQKYKQFGNSVTIPVIEELAHFMLACFDKMTNSQTSLVLKIAMENEYISKREWRSEPGSGLLSARKWNRPRRHCKLQRKRMERGRKLYAQHHRPSGGMQNENSRYEPRKRCDSGMRRYSSNASKQNGNRRQSSAACVWSRKWTTE